MKDGSDQKPQSISGQVYLYPSDETLGAGPEPAREGKLTNNSHPDNDDCGQVLQALRASEERYRVMVEMQVEAVCRWTADTTLTFVNEGYCKFFGKTRQELLGRPWLSLVPEKSQEKIRKLCEQIWSEPKVYTYEHEVLDADGQVRWQQWTDCPIYDANGKLIEFQSVGRDTTDRRWTEDALRESEERFRALIEKAWDGVALIGADGHLQYVSPSVTKILGYMPEEVLGSKVFALAHPEDQQRVAGYFDQLISKPGTSLSFQYRNRGKDKTWHWIEATATNLLDEPSVGAITANFREITERIQAEQALKHRVEMEKLIAAISTHFINLGPEQIDEGVSFALQKIGEFAGVDRSYIFLIAPDGETLDNTHEWCAPGIEPEIDNLQGLPTEGYEWWMNRIHRFENIYIPCVADLPPEASLEKQILEGQDIQSLIVVPMVSRDAAIGFLGFDSVREEKRWSEEDIRLMRTVSDILVNALERKRSEEALRRAKEELERRVVERTEALAKVNEDLRAEMAERLRAEAELTEVRRHLINSLEAERLVLARELHDGPMQDLYAFSYHLSTLDPRIEVQDWLEELKGMLAWLNRIIQDLRTTARQLRPPTLAQFGLEKAIRAHAESFQMQYPELEVVLELGADRQSLPETMRLGLYRIYQHALTNVVRHAAAKRVKVRFLFDAEQVVLEVRDDGRGFSLPERWVSIAREGHLGLIGSLERAEAIGGRLEIQSAPGQGTLVRVTVPRESNEG